MGEGPTPPLEQKPAPSAAPYRRSRACDCSRCGMGGLMGPVILITIGAIFMIDEFVPGVGFLWPLILIAIGAMKLLESSASTEGHRS